MMTKRAKTCKCGGRLKKLAEIRGLRRYMCDVCGIDVRISKITNKKVIAKLKEQPEVIISIDFIQRTLKELGRGNITIKFCSVLYQDLEGWYLEISARDGDSLVVVTIPMRTEYPAPQGWL